MIPFRVDGTDHFFLHDTNIGIIGRGVTLENSFEQIAEILFSLMVDVSTIHQIQVISFEFESENPEIALRTWLSLLLLKSKEHHLVFGEFRLKREGKFWKATIAGEPMRDGIEKKNDIKGILPGQLTVKKVDHLWEVRCVVDV